MDVMVQDRMLRWKLCLEYFFEGGNQLSREQYSGSIG